MVGKAELFTSNALSVGQAVEAIKRAFGYNDKRERVLHAHQGYWTIRIGGVNFMIIEGTMGAKVEANIPEKDGWAVGAALTAIARVIGGTVFYDFGTVRGIVGNQYKRNGGDINQIKRYQS